MLTKTKLTNIYTNKQTTWRHLVHSQPIRGLGGKRPLRSTEAPSEVWGPIAVVYFDSVYFSNLSRTIYVLIIKLAGFCSAAAILLHHVSMFCLIIVQHNNQAKFESKHYITMCNNQIKASFFSSEMPGKKTGFNFMIVKTKIPLL